MGGDHSRIPLYVGSVYYCIGFLPQVMLPVTGDPETLHPPGSSTTDADSTTPPISDRDRLVLEYLETRGRVSVEALADHLASTLSETQRSTVAEWGDALVGTRRRIHIGLRHSHLPRLEDAAVIDYDPYEKVVSIRAAGRSYLENTAEYRLD